MRNLYCSACNKLFKNVKSFENHENSKKHKENVANMSMEEDIGISDNEDEDEEVENVEVKNEAAETKVNGQPDNDKDQIGNSTSDIEDNDIRETLSDDSDQIQVYNTFTL